VFIIRLTINGCRVLPRPPNNYSPVDAAAVAHSKQHGRVQLRDWTTIMSVKSVARQSVTWIMSALNNLPYSFTDPGGTKGWVGLVGWPIAASLPTKRVICQP